MIFQNSINIFFWLKRLKRFSGIDSKWHERSSVRSSLSFTGSGYLTKTQTLAPLCIWSSTQKQSLHVESILSPPFFSFQNSYCCILYVLSPLFQKVCMCMCFLLLIQTHLTFTKTRDKETIIFFIVCTFRKCAVDCCWYIPKKNPGLRSIHSAL